MLPPIRMLHDRVLVEQVAAPTVTPGGILIPESAQDKGGEGIVRAVGRGVILPDGSIRKLAVLPGDRVVFGKFQGAKARVDDREYLVLHECDCLAVVEDAPAQA